MAYLLERLIIFLIEFSHSLWCMQSLTCNLTTDQLDSASDDGGGFNNIRRTAIPGSLRHTVHPWTFVAPPSLALCDIPSIPGHKKACSSEG